MHVDGGGLVHATHVNIYAENVTIDCGGVFKADGYGYSIKDGHSHNSDGSLNRGLHGVINPGRGHSIGGANEAAGAGGGGSGGRGNGEYRKFMVILARLRIWATIIILQINHWGILATRSTVR